MMARLHQNILFITMTVLVLTVVPFAVPIIKAASVGDSINFNIDRNFDTSDRNQITANLVKITDYLYFYIEKPWWESQTEAKKLEALSFLDNLSIEFNSNIHPKLTSLFGSEWKPGIDGDNKITILFHAMDSAEGGYFREVDEYIKLQAPTSNEREMVYLSVNYINDQKAKVILAHEFVHLITFNQKNKSFNIEEDTWLNEARADYSSTILGYDDIFEGSNLQQRIKDFVEDPSDSVLEWIGNKYDYASASMFMHYAVDHYGINILTSSLGSKYVGTNSINYALQKNGYNEDFHKIFTDWTITSVLGNCFVNQKYCYLNPSFKNFKINPSINFLPFSGEVSLSVLNFTKNWSGNWLKFIGGSGNLKVVFSNFSGFTFRVAYILEDSSNNYIVKFLELDTDGNGEVNIENFSKNYKSLIFIPSLQSDVYKIENAFPSYPYKYTVSISGFIKNDNPDLIQQLLNKIIVLRQEIARLQGQNNQNYCARLDNNLYFGMANNNEVRCLQTFLKNQGVNIYPEGLVTGNFGSLTKAAAVRFQAKYSIAQTGFVGPLTRAKINSILSGG